MEDFRVEEALGKPYDGRLMRRLLAYARPYWLLIAASISMLAFVTAAQLARPYFLQQAIDHYIPAHDGPGLARLALAYLGVVCAGFVFNYGQRYLLEYAGQRIIFRIRQDTFAHLQALSISYFDRNPVGRLVTRVTNDSEALNEMYTSVLVNLFKDVFLIAGIVAVMLRYDLLLALVSLAAFPLVVYVTAQYRRRAFAAWREVRVRLARINAFLNENITGMRIVQIFRREREQDRQFAAVNDDHLAASLRQLQVSALFRPSISFFSTLTIAALVWYGTGRVVSDSVTFGVLFLYINYVQQLFRPVNEIAEKFDILQAAMAASERIFRLLDERPAVVDPPTPVVLPAPRGEVDFEHVWFAYQNEEWVLKDVSFHVAPGETVAIVGHTGAGKSTILNLLARFYDVQRGRVCLDGVDVRLVGQAELRRRLGLILQDVFLFAEDVRENIRLHHPDISDEAVYRAAKVVGADEFIARLPQGYGTRLSERGSTLSAGQRQLIAFARALAFDPPVLVLDEATASVDSQTEQRVQAALRELTAGRTTIIVAHRLSTIQHADRILVLHRGELVEEGTHHSLLARGGLYARLYQLQRAGETAQAVARPARPAGAAGATGAAAAGDAAGS